MRSKLMLFTVIGLTALASARYLPAAVKDDGQNHLVKRQMENNPFAPKPATIQTLNIRLTDEEEDGGDGGDGVDGGGQGGDGPQTPRFSDTSSQQDEPDLEQGGGEDESEEVFEPPSFGGVGLVHAIDNIDIGPLQRGPNLIDPYAELESASETREEIRPEQVSELERPFNPIVDPNSGEPEYEYASFDFDEGDEGAEARKSVCTKGGGNKLIGPPPPPLQDLQRRPSDLPKYDRFGRRMGYILNEGEFHEDGIRDVPPYWGVIQPGHEVAEEPLYLDDDTDLGSLVDDLECLSVLGDSENPFARQSIRTDDDEEFYDANGPTEEQERIIIEDLREQLRATTTIDQGAPIDQESSVNQGGAPARDVDEVEEFVAGSLDNLQGEGSVSTDNDPMVGESIGDLVDSQLKTVEELFPNPKPEINLNTIVKINPGYFPTPERSERGRKQPSAAQRQVREEEEEKLDPEALLVQARLNELRGGDIPQESTRQSARSKSPLRRFGSFVASIPKKGVKTLVNKITGRRGRHAPATIEYAQNEVPSSTTVDFVESTTAKNEVIQPPNQQEVVGDINGNNQGAVTEPPNQQTVVEDINGNNQLVTQPLTQADDLGISTTGWGTGHDVYDVPVLSFEGDIDEEEARKTYYKRRLRK
ncbi:hypothetical protein TWF481_003577 [Arthrobotrys musiformis]|uniref:Uncharacterized protein n=1 Tax=Arthrobotrys musiformis TaxID=47236 RepID=A0AAV9WJ00_9PEZI